jgi:hypothetical protein
MDVEKISEAELCELFGGNGPKLHHTGSVKDVSTSQTSYIHQQRNKSESIFFSSEPGLMTDALFQTTESELEGAPFLYPEMAIFTSPVRNEPKNTLQYLIGPSIPMVQMGEQTQRTILKDYLKGQFQSRLLRRRTNEIPRNDFPLQNGCFAPSSSRSTFDIAPSSRQRSKTNFQQNRPEKTDTFNRKRANTGQHGARKGSAKHFSINVSEASQKLGTLYNPPFTPLAEKFNAVSIFGDQIESVFQPHSSDVMDSAIDESLFTRQSPNVESHGNDLQLFGALEHSTSLEARIYGFGGTPDHYTHYSKQNSSHGSNSLPYDFFAPSSQHDQFDFAYAGQAPAPSLFIPRQVLTWDTPSQRREEEMYIDPAKLTLNTGFQ